MVWNPENWGPRFWDVIHIVALFLDFMYTRQPEQAVKRWKNFIQGITGGIPCGQCEHHFLQYQKDHPIPTQSNGSSDPSFLKWTIRAHNNVRERNGKKLADEQDVVDAYIGGNPYRQTPSVGLVGVVEDQPKWFARPIVWWQISFVCALVLAIVFCCLFVKQKNRTPKSSKLPIRK